jgi:olefin beta-lactone synthetase
MSIQRNIADRLHQSAQAWPYQKAVVFPAGKDKQGRYTYSSFTFEQLDQESDRLARGLIQLGVQPGTRIALMVRPGLEFIALTFALFKAGAVIILIDPGMGGKNIIRCLAEVEPEGFVAIPLAQLIRRLKRRSFPKARLNVTVGKPVLTSGIDYQWLLGGDWESFEMVHRTATDPAAVIFTSGSTGPPKGVAYEHGMFWSQVDLLRDYYQIQPGEVDLPGFPLFALFNSAMGVTTVVPDMNPTRPALVDPQKIIAQINDQGVTQAFGSPAMWNRIGRYCEQHQIKLPSLKRILSAGAPVPVHVIERRYRIVAGGIDLRTRSAGGNLTADGVGRRNLRGDAIPGSAGQNYRDTQRTDCVPRSGGRTSCGRNRGNHRAGANGDARIFSPT